MPRGKGYGRKHGKHSRQVGEMRGGGRKKSGGATSDKVYSMQMKDPSSCTQRYHYRTGKK